ncbi:MAG: C40 family peptidase [Balneolia bacterium]|nr:C40 family peptidase [Balneolia bacterium]
MAHIIIKTATAPLRSADSESSEMVSQLLLGETAEVLETKERWVRVRCSHDKYEGWLSITQIHELTEQEVTGWVAYGLSSRSTNRLFKAVNSRGDVLLVPFGSVIHEPEPGLLKFPFGEFIATEQRAPEKRSFLEMARFFSGAPYLWGGRSELGIDCSGFVQVLYQAMGVQIPRDASQQIHAKECHSIKLEDAEPGDLIYFSFDGKNVVHVGIYIGDGLLIHASGDVHIDNLDASKRKTSPFAFNERLSKHICGVQRLGALQITND